MKTDIMLFAFCLFAGVEAYGNQDVEDALRRAHVAIANLDGFTKTFTGSQEDFDRTMSSIMSSTASQSNHDLHTAFQQALRRDKAHADQLSEIAKHAARSIRTSVQQASSDERDRVEDLSEKLADKADHGKDFAEKKIEAMYNKVEKALEHKIEAKDGVSYRGDEPILLSSRVVTASSTAPVVATELYAKKGSFAVLGNLPVIFFSVLASGMIVGFAMFTIMKNQPVHVVGGVPLLG